MNEQQLLRDPDAEPTKELIAECLGLTDGVYMEFLEQLQDHDVGMDWRYYNDGKAWLGKGLYKWVTSRGTPKEITVFWLAIWEGFFKVTVYVPEKHREAALSLTLSNEARKMIEDAKQIGKLKFFPLSFEMRSGEKFDDILTLIDFKKTLK